jgi:hypothetical protein
VEQHQTADTYRQAVIGEQFNPRYEACGFHPEEIVARSHDLTDGQKLLYTRLVRWARSKHGVRANERAGEVWRSQRNIATELGKSERQIRRDLKRLEVLVLIKLRVRDGRKSNTYVFLHHPWLQANQGRDFVSQHHLQSVPAVVGEARESLQDSSVTGGRPGSTEPIRPDIKSFSRCKIVRSRAAVADRSSPN